MVFHTPWDACMMLWRPLLQTRDTRWWHERGRLCSFFVLPGEFGWLLCNDCHAVFTNLNTQASASSLVGVLTASAFRIPIFIVKFLFSLIFIPLIYEKALLGSNEHINTECWSPGTASCHYNREWRITQDFLGKYWKESVPFFSLQQKCKCF